MQQAIEQAGSIFTGWFSFCLFRPDSNGDNKSSYHQQAMKRKGAEREMQICHTQPHLVPPMKLIVYDDLPSPGLTPRASSFPTWVMEESRNLASRASNRASMSFKRKSTTPLRISAPTDFRRVPTLPTPSREFYPLKLSFDNPTTPLPDLPRFSDYQMEEDPLHLPMRPPRALSYTTELTRVRTHRPSSSFNLPRKPVGSGSRRSSLATLELLMEKQTPPANPLIPHFSTRTPTSSVATGLAASVISSPPTWPDSAVGDGYHPKGKPHRESKDAITSTALKTPTTTIFQDKFLPSTPVKESPSSGSEVCQPPTTTVTSHPRESTSASPSRSRVTQWLLQTTPPKPSPPPSSIWKTNLSEKIPFRVRSRTLSGSTITPSIASMAGGFRPTPPLSSGTTTVRTSTMDSRVEKELEIPMSRPYVPRQTMSEEHTYSTIFEGQQHQHRGYAKEQCEDINQSYYNDHSRSTVGLAF